MDILEELNAEGTTIMLVTHDTKVAARTNRVLYMIDGRIVGDRDQNPSTNTDLDQRHTELARWLLEQERCGRDDAAAAHARVRCPADIARRVAVARTG